MRSSKSLAFRLVLVPVLLSGVLSSRPAHAVEPHSFSVSAGAFNVFDPDVRAEAGAEAQLSPFRLAWFPRWLPDLTPDAGAMVNDQGSFYVYGGLRCDFSQIGRAHV